MASHDRSTTAVPTDQAFTPLDESRMALYLSVLHARAEGTADPEIARSILGIDPDAYPGKAREAVEAHHRRALWLSSEDGCRHILKDDEPKP